MSSAEFSVHLGGGLYLNSRGELSRGPEPGKPVYGTPGGGLPVNPEVLAKAFQGIAKALPDKDNPKSREKFDKIFDGIGMAGQDKENLINVLQGIGAVASVIGSVVPIVGAALAVLTALLGLFKDGPSALEVMIERRFDDLQRTVRSLEIQIEQRDLRTQRNVISTALAALANYVVELRNTPPNEAALALRRQDVRAQITLASTATRNLLDSSTWLSSFDGGEYHAVWPWLAGRLMTSPARAPAQRASLPRQGANVFDHRLMVPLSAFAVTSFLTLLRAAAPEFRSTRENREDLWDFAQALETLANNMRNEGLARTVYSAADFQDGAGGGLAWGLGPEEVVDLSALGLGLRLVEGNTRFAVGALDLRQHNDVYFTPGFSASRIQLPGPQYAKQGLMNVRWSPPAKLEGYDVPVMRPGGWEPPNRPPPTERRYRITNPEACAQAANAQAESDFADLLFSSGYLNLVHLLATLRHEATDPDRSQTVRADAWLRRQAGVATAVRVESEPILLTGVISADAQRQLQTYKATASFTTQPLGRDRQLGYRVFLRTLPAAFSPGGAWVAEQAYEHFHQVGYTDDGAHPGCKQLYTSTGQPLDELLIAEGITSADARAASGAAVLQAITYDLWVPVEPVTLPGGVGREAALRASLRATGWEAARTPAPLPTRSNHGTPGARRGREMDIERNRYTEILGSLEGEAPAEAQHRRARQAEVRLDYTMRWQADRLTVALGGNRPEDRNYVAYVVVEETLGSGSVLHTTVRVPVVGDLTFVPQSFFDQEREAREKVARVFHDFAERYTESIGVGPRPGGPGGWRGLDPERIASDPVLRALEASSAGGHESLAGLFEIARAQPQATEALRLALAAAGVPEA